MLRLHIPKVDQFNDDDNTFTVIPEMTLEFEHSLVSLSKWEASWEKPFLGPDEKTTEEILGYMHCMCLTPDVPPEVYQNLSQDHVNQVNNYINAKMTATVITHKGPTNGRGRPREFITAEVIYYWMITLQIPIEFEHWHLSRLFTLIEVCNNKNSPPKKMSKRDMVSERQKLNAQRRAQQQSKG